MIRLIERRFEVAVSQETAWAHLANVSEWPSWGKHFRRCELIPPGALTAHSTARLHLKVGPTTTVTVSAFEPPHRWQWDGPFLWMTIHYNHVFEAVDAHKTTLIWTLDGEGVGIHILGRLFAFIYNRNLNVAIANLIRELASTSQSSSTKSS